MTQVIDAAGIRDYTHKNDGQVSTENITGTGLLSGYTTTHSFGTAGHGLRDSVSVANGSSTIVANSFTYEPSTGRFHTASQAGHTATYGYQANTDWEASISHNAGSSSIFTKRTHRDQGGRVTGVVARAGNAPGGQILSSAGYLLDAKGRRESLTREDGTRWEYGYNTRDEVETGAKRQASGNLLAGRQFSYQYDDVGNRKTARFGGDGNGGNLRTINYTPDELNQYAAITHPGIAQVLGYSPDAGAITATPGQQGSTTVQGNFWRAEVSASNSTTGIWADVEARQTVSGTPATIGQGKLWIPPANTIPVHDDDGNLTQDGRWVYQWNGENRLIGMTPTAGALTGGHPWMRLTFQYDFMGRRIHKKVETGSSGTPVVTVNRRFLYDGWNLVAEIESASGTANTLATYLWGLDLSGSEQGAGGVGGLLLITDHSALLTSSYPSYDGNGNIIAWIGAAGSVVTRIDYDPFGQVLSRQGGGNGMAFGFSTKYTDIESGLCYYGYRYYDPLTGRWPSRDPIGERGGVNLYGFVGNDGIMKIDRNGLDIAVGIGGGGGMVINTPDTPQVKGPWSKINPDIYVMQQWHHTRQGVRVWWDCCKCSSEKVSSILKKAFENFSEFNKSAGVANVEIQGDQAGFDLTKNPDGWLSDLVNSNRAMVTLSGPGSGFDQEARTNGLHPIFGIRRWGHEVSSLYGCGKNQGGSGLVELWTEAYETTRGWENGIAGRRGWDTAIKMWNDYLDGVSKTLINCGGVTYQPANQQTEEITPNQNIPWLNH